MKKLSSNETAGGETAASAKCIWRDLGLVELSCENSVLRSDVRWQVMWRDGQNAGIKKVKAFL